MPQPTAPPHTPNLRCKKYNIFPVHAMKAYGEIRSLTPLILNLGTRVVNVQLHISAIYSLENKILYPLYRKLYGGHSGTGNFGKGKSLLRLSGLETNTKYHKAYCVIPVQRIFFVIMAFTVFYFRKGLIA
jgi:hypothetical protein